MKKGETTQEYYDTKPSGRRMIYRTTSDTEVASVYTNVKCPYCGHEQQEIDMDWCGVTYTIECDDCEKEYEMYFDAS